MYVLVVYDDNLEMASRIRYDRFSLDRLAAHVEACERFGFTFTVYDWDVAIDYAVPFVMA